MTRKRKVCISGPPRLTLPQEMLKGSGYELILGKPVDDFPGIHYKKEDLISLIGDADGLLVSTREGVGRDILERCKNLQAITKASIGVEKIELDAATDLGILVCNSPAPENFTGLAEAVVGLMVALFKRLKSNEVYLRQGGWKKSYLRGQLMVGKTIGIIGLGRVGRQVAKRLKAWELHLIGYDPYVKQQDLDPLGVKLVSLDELLQSSDLITIHVVVNSETRHMIKLKEFRMMKPTAYLINTSRGIVVKEGDLIQAIHQGMIAGAALDVFDDEPLPMRSQLREMDPERLILTPHIIGNNPESEESGHRMAVQSMLSILKGKVPSNLINPEAIERWRARFWS